VRPDSQPVVGAVYRVAPNKLSHYQIIKISYYIVLKPANEIGFICQIKVSIKH